MARHYTLKETDGARSLKPGMAWAEAEPILNSAEINNRRVHGLGDLWRLISLTLDQGGVSSYLRKIGDRIYMQWRQPIHPSWLTGPVLYLDATMPERAAREYLPRLGAVESLRVQTPCVSVRQITDSAMPMTALVPNERASKRKNRERLANIERLSRYIAVRAARYRKVLVITYKGIEGALRVPDKVTSAHFGAITGIDAWGDVDLLIVVGRTEPSPTAMENVARTAHARDVNSISPNANGDIRYSSVFRGVRLRKSGGCATVRNSEHPDADVEELRWVTCEGGLLQAIGRARGVNRTENTPLQVDILTNVALPLVVDEAVLWSEIEPTRIAVAAATAPAKALPLSDAELARCFPGLWRSSKSVETERAREKGASREGRVRAGWGGVPLLHATYRRTLGRGGLPSRAVISTSETDPRAALEAVIGPVVEFQLG
jgi:putative DNA primase/helicase